MARERNYHEELLRKLTENGHRITEQRKCLLMLLLETERPLSAMEIYQDMANEFAGLSYGTVYQNIKLFSELKLIEPFAFANEVRFRLADVERPHYHLICQACGKMISVQFDPNQLKLFLPENFQLFNYQLDIFGQCGTCHDDKPQMEAHYQAIPG